MVVISVVAAAVDFWWKGGRRKLKKERNLPHLQDRGSSASEVESLFWLQKHTDRRANKERKKEKKGNYANRVNNLPEHEEKV